MKIEAYKCRFTGKVFEKKDTMKYVLHLQDLRTKMQAERATKRLKDNWESWLKAEKEHFNFFRTVWK